jgi:post-segregation antitoxin (ccd killing protein)
MNVYVGRDLYDRVVTELPDVNISEVCRTAIKALIRRRATCQHVTCKCVTCGTQVRRDAPPG